MLDTVPRLSPYDRPVNGSGLLPNGMTIDEIPADAVYVFEENSSSIYDIFNSPTAAANAMGIDYYNVTRHINKNYLVAAGAAAISSMLNKKFTF